METTTEWLVRRAQVEDATSIVRAIERCYEGTYCSASGLSPSTFAAELDRGDAVYAVARAGSVHLGQVGLERRGTAGLYEYSKGSVIPEVRGAGVFSALSRLLFGQLAPSVGARFVFGKFLASHTHAQQTAVREQFVTTGVLLGVFPAATRVEGFGSVGLPIPAVLMVRRFEASPGPRTIALEGPDRERAARALDALGVRVSRGVPRSTGSRLGASVARDPSLGVVHLRLDPQAPPLEPMSLDDDALEADGARVVWADVPVSHPDAPRACAWLRDRGLSFGGYLPLGGRNGEDVLRLQAHVEPGRTLPENVEVVGEAQALCADVLADAGALVGVA